MIFLTLRNNRKLSRNSAETLRKLFFGLISAGVILLLIFALDVDVDQFKTTYTAFDIHYLSSLVITFISIPLTMFILLAMNKNEYGKKIFKYLFEVTYMLTCIALATAFYLHLISVLWIQAWFLLVALINTFLSFTFSRTHINYKATTMFGPLIVKPLSFSKKMTGVLGFSYLILAFLLQGSNIIFFKYVDIDVKNYSVYQFILQAISTVFYLLCVAVFSRSRSIGQSQEVLYYRYTQLLIITLIFVVIGLAVYRFLLPVATVRSLTDDISMTLNALPLIILGIDLRINAIRIKKNKYYQGLTELRILIKIFASVTFVLLNMIIGTEVKFFLTGEVQESIDVTLVSVVAIILMIAIPFFSFWKKITKRSSRVLIVFLMLIFSFIIYKFYFYVDITNLGATVLGMPVDSLYTMVALLGVIVVQIITIALQARNSSIAYKRYGHTNTDEKEVKNG